MQNYLDEVDGNFARFYASLLGEIGNTINGLAAQEQQFKESYRRLVSLQAWRGELIEKIVPPAAEAFFKEAQNDGLMSHSLARQGAWRVALMSLRSCIENTLYGLYYMDHPVELAQWQSGGFKLGFTDSINYLTKHPRFEGIGEQNSGIDIIKAEYATLSKAVHGSAHSFRVTKTGEIHGLNVVSLPELGAWRTRERQTLIALNSILLVMFREHLQGAANANLRKAISLTIPEQKHDAIKELFKVRLRSVPKPAAA
jgi:hypothetical protein